MILSAQIDYIVLREYEIYHLEPWGNKNTSYDQTMIQLNKLRKS